MINSINDANSEHKNFWSRPTSVFIVASVVLLVSLLIPCSPIALDVIWIFAFLIACAVTWVCISVRQTTDLTGLASLASFLTLLRLSLQIITAEKIIRHQPTGVLLTNVDNILATSGVLASLLICLLLAVIAVIIIFTSCQRISIASNNYLQNILPLKQIGIETDLRLETIDAAGAKILRDRIACESRFFSGMNSTGLLMRSEAAVCILTLIVCLTLPMTTTTSKTISGMEYLTQVAPPVMALSIFSLIPAVIISISCGTLMNRDILTLRTEQSDEVVVPPQKITIINEHDGHGEDFELINPEFLKHKNVDERIVTFEPKEKLSAEETSCQSEVSKIPKDVQSPLSPIVESIQIKGKNANDYYDKLYSLISTADRDRNIAVLTSGQVYSLPVTVPVNIAIRLVQKKQKVLLVDVNTEQNAIAQVFEIDPDRIYKKVRPSCFENLSICGIPAKSVNSMTRKSDVLNHFDKILIYAPNTQQINFDCQNGLRVDVLYFTDKGDTALSTLAGSSFINCAGIRLVPDIRSILED